MALGGVRRGPHPDRTSNVMVILDDPTLSGQRKARDQRMAEDREAKTYSEPESNVSESDLLSTDANPKHREDFNFLLDAAVKKRERED